MSACVGSCVGGPVIEKYHHTSSIKDYIEVANYAEFAQQYQILSGVIVISVMEDGPALKAGLQPYDVIISLDGKPIETFSDLTSAIADAGIGETVELEILRGYQEGDPQIVTKSLTIAEKNSTGRK